MISKGFSNAFALALPRLSLLLVTLTYANITNKVIFEYETTMLILSVSISSVASMALGMVANRYISRHNHKEFRELVWRVCMKISVCSAFIFAVSVIMLSDWISNIYLDGSNTLFPIIIAAIVFVFPPLVAIKGCYQGLQKYRELALVSVVSTLVFVFLSYVLIVYEYRGALLFSTFGMYAVEFAILLYLNPLDLFSKKRKRKNIERKVLYSICRISLPVVLSGFSLSSIMPVALYYIKSANIEGSIFLSNIIFQFVNVALFLPMAFSSVVLSILSRKEGGSGEHVFVTGMLCGIISVTLVFLLLVGYLDFIDVTDDYLLLLLIFYFSTILSAISLPFSQEMFARLLGAKIVICNIGKAIFFSVCAYAFTTHIFLAIPVVSISLSFLMANLFLFVAQYFIVCKYRVNEVYNVGRIQ